jgi:hypothetical protein
MERSESLEIKLTRAMKADIERLAILEQRTMSQMATVLLQEAMIAREEKGNTE